MSRSVLAPGSRAPARPGPGRVDLRRLQGRVQHRRGPFVLRLWIPLTPLVILLAPVAMLAAPLAHRQARARGMNPWVAAWALGAVLRSLSGTSVDVETRAARIHLRLF